MNHDIPVNSNPPPASADYQRGIADALTAINAFLPAALHEVQQTQPPSELMRALTFLPRPESARLNYQAGSVVMCEVLASKIDDLLIQHRT